MLVYLDQRTEVTHNRGDGPSQANRNIGIKGFYGDADIGADGCKGVL